MEILTKYELRLRKEEIIDKIKAGAIFIHPTDTIYGLGCNALDENAVKRLRKLKERQDTPFSVWSPSKEWIKENSQNLNSLIKWLGELPGAYTLITTINESSQLAPNVNPKNNSLGVRMPDHWFQEIVSELNLPIVTTSANKKGEAFMTSVENLDPNIRAGVDFIIYEGEKKARPSRIVNLEKEEITER